VSGVREGTTLTRLSGGLSQRERRNVSLSLWERARVRAFLLIPDT
jgi:hypothetical protein